MAQNDNNNPITEREAALLAIALEKSNGQRKAFLDAVCGGDAELRSRLEMLLATREPSETVLAVDNIRLQAGQRYCVEAWLRQFRGGSHIAVTWKRPGDPIPPVGAPPMPGAFLAHSESAP
jgi:hypothetical protein